MRSVSAHDAKARFGQLLEAANPVLWHARAEVGVGICSWVETSHVIFFSSKRSTINVLRLLRGHMDPAGQVGS